MRGRAIGFLLVVEDRLSRDTAQLAHELIDANEYGVAVEIIRDWLSEHGVTLAPHERSMLTGMLSEMGLDSPE